MADLAQIQKILKQELVPVNEKLNAVEGNLKQLTTSFEFLSMTNMTSFLNRQKHLTRK
jgi:hypothetical protein